jgi:hypothetical protein
VDVALACAEFYFGNSSQLESFPTSRGVIVLLITESGIHKVWPPKTVWSRLPGTYLRPKPTVP